MLRPEAEEKWRNLVGMIPEWIPRVRHPSQFWTQFHALVGEIEVECGARERGELRVRVEELIRVLGPQLADD